MNRKEIKNRIERLKRLKRVQAEIDKQWLVDYKNNASHIHPQAAKMGLEHQFSQ